MRNVRKGFTLVELSIVLVIIGLLIGGILVAQSMIETVRVQRFVREIQQYEIAANNFKVNFRFYPGDSNLFTPLGIPDHILGYGPAGVNTSCNGLYTNFEEYHSFAHLSQSGMLKAQYVPYQPMECGGSMGDYTLDVGGVVAPFTKVDAKAVTYLGTEKRLIRTTTRGTFGFRFDVNVSDVLAMEAKLGVIPSGESVVGLTNDFGPGQCFHIDTDEGGPCNDSGATYGHLIYYIPSP